MPDTGTFDSYTNAASYFQIARSGVVLEVQDSDLRVVFFPIRVKPPREQLSGSEEQYFAIFIVEPTTSFKTTDRRVIFPIRHRGES